MLAARWREQHGACWDRDACSCFCSAKLSFVYVPCNQVASTCAPMHQKWQLMAQCHFSHTSSPAHPTVAQRCAMPPYPSGPLPFSCLPGYTGAKHPVVSVHLDAQHDDVYREITTNHPHPGASQAPSSAPPAVARLLMDACNTRTCKGIAS